MVQTGFDLTARGDQPPLAHLVDILRNLIYKTFTYLLSIEIRRFESKGEETVLNINY